MRSIQFWVWVLLTIMKVSAQDTVIRGVVVDASTYEPVQNINVQIEGTTLTTLTNDEGIFQFSSEGIPEGKQVLILTKPGYMLLRLPVVINGGATKDLEVIPLQEDMFKEQLQVGAISLLDSQLSEDEGNTDNVAGLLYSTPDAFLNAAAFDFSQTFFKPRGMDSDLGKVFINGIEMNKLFNGRPQWSNWGGLNDSQRNQVFTIGMTPSEVGFGGLAGTINIIMRASKYPRGGRVSYAASNRSYTGRIMATYNSGETPNGWSYALSVSRRFAEEAFIEGTPYDANAFFVSVEKKLSSYHSLNFTSFYTPNIRGKSSANTQEVYDLKGQQYNSLWGFQDGKIRNSRIREIKEPVFMLNHFWKISEKTELNTNLSYQFGKIGNSRIDFGGTRLVSQPAGQESFVGGGSNPDPAYYQKLPSYFLRFANNQNYLGAYMARQSIQDNGQLNWKDLYQSNFTSSESGGNSIYIIAEDRNDDNQMTANTIFNVVLNSHFKLNSTLRYTRLRGDNFASVKDLLGGDGYLDIDFFAEADAQYSVGDRSQSDLQNRNRIVTEGDRFKYNFQLQAEVLEANSFVQFKSKRLDLYLAGSISQSEYLRIGLYQNGSYPENSLGKSSPVEFLNFGGKFGGTFKITGRHLLDFNSGYFTKAPNLRNTFSNSRQNNEIVKGLESEILSSFDASYIYRTTFFRTRLTGYFTQIDEATKISFYYADGLSGLGRTSTTAFVQEILTGIGKLHFGLEFGMDFQVTSTIKLKGALAVGQYTYSKNPNLYLTSDSFVEPVNYGRANLKNFRIAGGPQRAAQIGFEYRDPNFWWFGTSVNFFSHAFADIGPLNRTSNFLTDTDGLPLLNYDETVARDLLKQEMFDEYFLVNAIGGKSWRIKSYTVGFFVSLNNIFDTLYKTGGFEQSRNANYRTLKEDKEREQPLFGNKYWYGTGASYFANVYFRY
jgi:hypothetical protein